MDISNFRCGPQQGQHRFVCPLYSGPYYTFFILTGGFWDATKSKLQVGYYAQDCPKRRPERYFYSCSCCSILRRVLSDPSESRIANFRILPIFRISGAAALISEKERQKGICNKVRSGHFFPAIPNMQSWVKTFLLSFENHTQNVCCLPQNCTMAQRETIITP